MAVSVSRLSRAQLPRLKEYLYDQELGEPAIGIVHFGLGNFHRAHMAVYLDDLFNLGESHDWAIIGAGVRAPDSRMRDALKGQDCLSTIIELDPQGKTCRRVGAMIDFLPVEPDNASLIAAMSDPQIRIVSLTVTEGGYFVNPATGKFDPAAPEIVADGANPGAPVTAFGAIVAALKARRAAGIPPFTVMSCDNLPGNGHVTHDAVIGLARLSDPELAAWIRSALPGFMVPDHWLPWPDLGGNLKPSRQRLGKLARQLTTLSQQAERDRTHNFPICSENTKRNM